MAVMKNETRTYEEIRQHYEIEKDLALQLRNASKQDRKHLYTELYDELFRRVPTHPLLTKKQDEKARTKAVDEQMELLKHFLFPDCVYLEVGPGDCSLALAVAKVVKTVYAVDVSEEITRNNVLPDNFHLVISDGTSIPAPDNSVNIAFSNQLMEHLHPDDALEQLRNIYNALAPKGMYICITPNSLVGPHDVSKYFDEFATGFHLKEYMTTELFNLFRAVGFSKIQVYFKVKGFVVLLPVMPVLLLEALLMRLPRSSRKALSRRLRLGKLLGKIVGTK